MPRKKRSNKKDIKINTEEVIFKYVGWLEEITSIVGPVKRLEHFKVTDPDKIAILDNMETFERVDKNNLNFLEEEIDDIPSKDPKKVFNEMVEMEDNI